MSNHTTKMATVSIEINGGLYCPEIWHGKTFETLHAALDVRMHSELYI